MAENTANNTEYLEITDFIFYIILYVTWFDLLCRLDYGIRPTKVKL